MKINPGKDFLKKEENLENVSSDLFKLLSLS